MVPHFKHYFNYSQRNSNSKLGLKLQMLKTGADGSSVKLSMVVAFQYGNHWQCGLPIWQPLAMILSLWYELIAK